ncbi:MAG: hydrolase [Sphingomonas bacterium]|uniref:hydrolase n=1 Tax=Sphingomonas bacterium TaxID=1895847 RepID=UPI00260FEB04|nr:hydrolase [Sphingomonas bacterium]MDB5707916.1 hydrolase [Sphingomonas bacterium]
MEPLDPATTALILVDLQNGIVGMQIAPRSGPEVVETAKALAARFRAAGAPVVQVHVGWRADGADRPSQAADRPSPFPPGGLPEAFTQFSDGVREPGDIAVLKHHWGAFTGTDLDLQLRRRGIRTVVLAGIATNFGVESTARSAWELSYDVVIAEDATTSRSAELHDFAIQHILPQIARIRPGAEIALRG